MSSQSFSPVGIGAVADGAADGVDSFRGSVKRLAVLIVLLVVVASVTGAVTGAARSVAATSGSALIGGTPRGASNAAGVAAMDADYGKAKVVRLFWSGAAGTSPTSNREVVGSIKTVSSSTAPWARTMWRWAYQHEIDSKIKKGLMSLAQWRSTMNSLVAMKVPGLSVILTADAFVNPSKHPSDFLIPGVTHWGVDFDGISSSSGYHNYAKELAAVTAFTSAHHLSWGVAEFGANRASNDPSGTARAAWLKTWAAKFTQAGAEYVCLWENNFQSGSNFTTTAETAAVRQLLGSSPSTPPHPAPNPNLPNVADGYYKTNPNGLIYKVTSQQRWRVSTATWNRIRSHTVPHPITQTTINKLPLRGLV